MRVIQSRRVGVGKSLYIMRRAEELTEKFSVSDPLVSIHIHGPSIAESRIMDRLQSLRVRQNKACIVHFDISPSVSYCIIFFLPVISFKKLFKPSLCCDILQMVKFVDCLLFSILVLGYFTDIHGNLWRRDLSHLYMVEITLPPNAEEKRCAAKRLLHLLPSLMCCSPSIRSGLHHAGVHSSTSHGQLDWKKFISSSYQIVYQYLKRYNSSSTADLNCFKFVPGVVEGDEGDFLKYIFK